MINNYKLYTADDAAERKYYKDTLNYEAFTKQNEGDWLPSFQAFKRQVLGEHSGLVNESELRINRPAEVACILLSSDRRVLGVVFLHDPARLAVAA